MSWVDKILIVHEDSRVIGLKSLQDNMITYFDKYHCAHTVLDLLHMFHEKGLIQRPVVKSSTDGYKSY